MENELMKIKCCPICDSKDVQLNEYRELKPDINCNECGISLQGESVADAVERWNLFTRTGHVLDVLRGWRDWFNGPAAQGIGYIAPPLSKTDAILSKSDDGGSDLWKTN